MKNISKICVVLLLFLTGTFHSSAQETSAGNSYYLDYETWNEGGQPWMYIDCGNNNSFNLGYEFTLECWLRIYDAQWNQKLMGKMTDALEDGYVMGIEVQGLYSEVLYPGEVVELKTPGAFRRDSSWVHLVTTYSAGGSCIGYVNGQKVSEITNVPSGPVPSNEAPFIIARAPWGTSFMSFGNMDEIRVWNYARSAEEIAASLHKNIAGDAPGLVAYYDFNTDADTIVHDKSLYENNGVVKNADNDFWGFVPSYAPVGDEQMTNQTDVHAIWYGKSMDDAEYNRAITDNGMSMLGAIPLKSFDYALFGHNAETGLTNELLPEDFPTDFQRANRTWYVNKGGNPIADLVINLDAAGAGEMPTDYALNNYTLLARSADDATFKAVAAASEKMGNAYMFKSIALNNATEYTIGVASEAVISGESISEWNNYNNNIHFYPNPATESINIQGAQDSYISIMDISGRIIAQEFCGQQTSELNLSTLESGVNFIEFSKDDLKIRRKLILN